MIEAVRGLPVQQPLLIGNKYIYIYIYVYLHVPTKAHRLKGMSSCTPSAIPQAQSMQKSPEP